MADFPLMLAGPIVRRQESKVVAIWLALSRSAKVTVRVYQGDVDATTAPPPQVAAGAEDTVRLGENLHIVVVSAPVLTGTFLPGQLYSYDVQIAAGADTATLLSLGLLDDDTAWPNGYKQPALGYRKNFLPGFMTPPADLAGLRILQGSCRRPHATGRDALRHVDRLIDPTATPGEAPLDARPHMLFLTGDQIYADEVAIPLLRHANLVGANVLGGQSEPISVGAQTFPATLDAFPAAFRNRLVQNSAKVTAGLPQKTPEEDTKVEDRHIDCHLLSFGEFCGMYLLTLSNVLWPKVDPANPGNRGFDPPTVANAPAPGPSHPADVNDDIAKDPKQLVLDDCHRRQKYCSQLNELVAGDASRNDFLGGLGETRRALANVATYMIFDDHEVSDDWNLSLNWKRDVLGAPLGRQIVRNALLAYTFFQGWGNDPGAFAQTGANGGYLARAVQAAQATTTAGADLTVADADLGIADVTQAPKVRWYYQLLDPSWRFGVLVLDERTRRGFGSNPDFPSGTAPPARIAPIAMTEMIPNPLPFAGREVLFVVASGPVLGVPVIEELLQPGYARFSNLVHARRPVGQLEVDEEPWSQDPAAFEELLRLLAPAGRIVFLSGDVHFAHGASLSYWRRDLPAPSRFAQFTSSAVKNQADDWELDLIRTFGFAQRVFRSGAPTARLGWTENSPNPLSFTGAPLQTYPLQVRVRFRRSPLLLPAEVWPADVQFAIEPDWRWRLELTFDRRPEAGRVGDDRPDPLPDVPLTPPIPRDRLSEVAAYHIEAQKHRGISRQTVFTNNIGLVSLTQDRTTGFITAQHTVLSTPINADDTFKPLTIHTVELDLAADIRQPGLQAP